MKGTARHGSLRARCWLRDALISQIGLDWCVLLLLCTVHQDWFLNMLPRMRRAGADDKGLIQFIQHPGETVFLPGGWWHAVLNLDDTIAVTQNFCSRTNFPRVWKATRRGRRKMAVRFLEELDKSWPQLARSAREYVGEQVVAVNDLWLLLPQSNTVGCCASVHICICFCVSIPTHSVADFVAGSTVHTPQIQRGRRLGGGGRKICQGAGRARARNQLLLLFIFIIRQR